MILEFCSTSRDHCTAVCDILAQGIIINKKTTISSPELGDDFSSEPSKKLISSKDALT